MLDWPTSYRERIINDVCPRLYSGLYSPPSPHFQTHIILCHWYKSSHYILLLQNLLYANEVLCLLIMWSSRIIHRVAWEIVTNVMNKHTARNVSMRVVICTVQMEAVCSFSTLIPTYHKPRRRIKRTSILFCLIHCFTAQLVIFVHT
jgi:hypothetical protein